MQQRYRFLICDVFTDRRFGGNQLAVLPHTEGLTDDEMQQIAREFNFSETTFVFPPSDGGTRRVRIFTPSTEVPFAGHPNVGTAFVLATIGELGEISSPTQVTFEEQAGAVVVRIEPGSGGLRCTVTAPRPLAIGASIDPALAATALSLSPDDVVMTKHPPQVVSVGLPFLFVELRDRRALSDARINFDGFEAVRTAGVIPDILCYVRTADEFDVRARMFAPFDGVPEDPATGSAACALSGLLCQLATAGDCTLRLRIAQGFEMGRPSVLAAEADKVGGTVTATRVGGSSVLVCDGHLLA